LRELRFGGFACLSRGSPLLRIHERTGDDRGYSARVEDPITASVEMMLPTPMNTMPTRQNRLCVRADFRTERGRDWHELNSCPKRPGASE
jgi:hypothetical protein